MVGVVLTATLAGGGDDSHGPIVDIDIDSDTVTLVGCSLVGPWQFVEEQNAVDCTSLPEGTSSGLGDSTVLATDPGVYAFDPDVPACDSESLFSKLEADPKKLEAWAGVIGIKTGDVGPYIQGLTPLLLGEDARVTNHGFRDGTAYRFQAVLERGTAVLVDAFGAPTVRCACGNPLLPPEPVEEPRYEGDQWPAFSPVTIEPTSRPNETLQVLDLNTGSLVRVELGTGEPPPTPTAVDPPTAWPSDAELTLVSASADALQLSWDPATGNVATYEIQLNGEVTVANVAANTATLPGTADPGNYRVIAIPQSGEPVPGPTLTYEGDRAGPMWPSNTRLAAELEGDGAVVLTWPPAVDDYALGGYRLVEAGEVLAELPADARSFTWPDPEPGVHIVELIAFDTTGNEAQLTASLNVPPPSTAVPPTSEPPTPEPQTPTPPPPTPPPPTATPPPDRGCTLADFSTQAEAQAWFDQWYPQYGDYANLDGNDDLVACENLP